MNEKDSYNLELSNWETREACLAGGMYKAVDTEDQKLSFKHVKLEMTIRHPEEDSGQAIEYSNLQFTKEVWAGD